MKLFGGNFSVRRFANSNFDELVGAILFCALCDWAVFSWPPIYSLISLIFLMLVALFCVMNSCCWAADPISNLLEPDPFYISSSLSLALLALLFLPLPGFDSLPGELLGLM